MRHDPEEAVPVTDTDTGGRGVKEPDDIKRDTSGALGGAPAELTDR